MRKKLQVRLAPAEKGQRIAELEKSKTDLTEKLDLKANEVTEARAKSDSINVSRLEDAWILLMYQYEKVVDELNDLESY